MPQGRIILKRICQSRKLADLKSDGARLLYTWLIPNVDINGCFSGDPQVIKGQVFTRLKKSPKTIRGYLEDMASVGLVFLYESNGDTFLHIPDFVEKQPSLNPAKEAEPTIPPPTPEQLQTYSGPTPRKVKESKEEVKESKEKAKHTYLEFVKLTNPEHAKLVDKFGDKGATDWIEELDGAIGSKGYKYASHYRTILNWSRRREQSSTTQSQRSGTPQTGRQPSTARKKRDYGDQTSAFGDTFDNTKPDG